MDVLHDNSNRMWFQIGTQHEKLIPRYVMDHELNKEAAADLPDRQYADTVDRLFPLDSPADVWLSAAYFAKNASQYAKPILRQHVEQNILKAAEAFGISNDVAAITSAIKGTEKQASATNEDFGWVDGSVRRYPMLDSRGVKLAAQHFVENRDKYEFAVRRTIAGKILEKAAQYDVRDIPDCVRKEAGHGMPRRDTLMAELLERAHLIKDAELALCVANLNELVATQPMEDLAPELDKIAELVEAIDRVEGLDKHYGRRVLCPTDFVFDIDVKLASVAAEDTVELDKHMFSVTKLAALEPSIYGDCLGDDFAQRITVDGKVCQEKLADELFSLPRPDRIALERHLADTFG